MVRNRCHTLLHHLALPFWPPQILMFPCSISPYHTQLTVWIGLYVPGRVLRVLKGHRSSRCRRCRLSVSSCATPGRCLIPPPSAPALPPLAAAPPPVFLGGFVI